MDLWGGRYIAFGGWGKVHLLYRVELDFVGKAELSESFLGGGTQDGEERMLVDKLHLGLGRVDIDIHARRIYL